MPQSAHMPPPWLFPALLAPVLLLAACGEQEVVYDQSRDFSTFAVEVADALALGDVERLVANTTRARVVCDEQLVQEAKACQGLAVGAETEGFDVGVFGKGNKILDGDEIRLLLEGMVFGADLQSPPDQFGAPGLVVYSTRLPDPALWFPTDDPDKLPIRGDIAITYIGRSPSEDDGVQRRLWAAVAEQGGDGAWTIRLWLVGFYRPDHPALNPSEENGFKRWALPSAVRPSGLRAVQ